MFTSILSSGAAYEIYSNKVNKGREVIFDQLFVTNILSVLWRMGKYSDSVIEYLVRAMPVPDLVIYISASPSVCVGRQKSRGRVQTSKYNWCSNIVDEQILYNGICDKMVNDLRKITSVKEVSNEGDLCNTKDKIKHIIQ
jgi:deoxyadenosine/deoxycytidine kinase